MTAASVTALTRTRAPRSRRSSPRGRAVLPAPPPRSGPWPTPAPTVVSPAPAGRYGHHAHPAAADPAARTTRPTRPHPGPDATPQYGWNTSPPGAAAHPSHPRRVIRREDLQLVLRGKRPPPRPRGHLRIRTFPASARHSP